MADVKILSKTERLGAVLQDNWQTPADATAAFYTMQWVNAGVLIPDPAVTIDNFNVTSQSVIHFEKERAVVDARSGLQSIPISGIAEKSSMAPLLYGAHFVASEAVGTPYNKVITCGGLTAPIDFNGNGTKLFTYAIDQGGDDDGVILENAIVDSLNLVWDMNADGTGRFVSYSGMLKGYEMKF